MAEEDSPYDFAEPVPPPPSKRTSLPGKPVPPATSSPSAKTSPAIPAASAPPAVTAAAAVERTCPQCGFTYVGKAKGRCPECAAAQDASSADRLQFADPRWVRAVALGSMLIVLAIMLHITGAVVRWFDQPLKGVFHGAGAILLLIAVFVATRKESATSGSALAGIARVAAVAAAILWIIMCASACGFFALGNIPLRILVASALALHIAISIPLGSYFSRLAQRVPDDSLASHAGIVGWLCGAVSATMLVLKAADVTGPDHLGFFICSFPMIAGFMAIFIWTMITLLRFGLNLRATADAGESMAQKRSERMATRKKPA